MATVVVVGKRNGKKVIMNDGAAKQPKKPQTSYSSDGPQRNNENALISGSMNEIRRKVAEAFETSPVPLEFKLIQGRFGVVVEFKFLKESKLSVNYTNAETNGIYDGEKMAQTIIGLLYKNFKEQTADGKLEKYVEKAKKKELFNAVISYVNEEFEKNEKQGLMWNPKTKTWMAVFNEETFKVNVSSGWFAFEDYKAMEENFYKTSAAVFVEKMLPEAVFDLKEAVKDIKLFSKEKAPNIKEVLDKRDEILAKHDMLLDGRKSKSIFGTPKLLYMVTTPNTKYIQSAAGIFASDDNWQTVEYKEQFADSAKWILDKEYQDILKKFYKGVKKAKLTYISYNGGAGLLNIGKTRVIVGKKDENITIEINVTEEMDFKNNAETFASYISELYDQTKDEYLAEEKRIFEVRMADTVIHEKKKKIFEKAHKRLYTGEATQMMFLYIEKNGGKVSRKAFDKFVSEKCYADDIRDVMMYLLASAQVIQFDNKQVYLAPKAKYMRLFTEEVLKVNENGVNKVLKELSELSKTLRAERDEKKALAVNKEAVG